MSERAPAGARCAAHPDVDALWACRRCGSFFCGACERRVRPDAQPMCPACWALRAQVVVDQRKPSSANLFNSSLGLGIACVLPVPVLYAISLVVGVMALFQAREQRAQRWKAVTGLGLTIGFGLLWVLAVIAMA